MAATLTVTGKAGPGLTVTAVAFTGVTSFTVDPNNNLLSFSTQSGQVTTIDINAQTTVTATKTTTAPSAVWTLTVS